MKDVSEAEVTMMALSLAAGARGVPNDLFGVTRARRRGGYSHYSRLSPNITLNERNMAKAASDN